MINTTFWYAIVYLLISTSWENGVCELDLCIANLELMIKNQFKGKIEVPCIYGKIRCLHTTSCPDFKNLAPENIVSMSEA